VQSIAQCLRLLTTFAGYYSDLPSYKEIFALVRHYVMLLPLSKYPNAIKVWGGFMLFDISVEVFLQNADNDWWWFYHRDFFFCCSVISKGIWPIKAVSSHNLSTSLNLSGNMVRNDCLPLKRKPSQDGRIVLKVLEQFLFQFSSTWKDLEKTIGLRKFWNLM